MSTALNLISGAVQLVWCKALSNYMEPAFAIHGQLFVRLSGMAAVDTYLSGVEMPAERRWLCSSAYFLAQPRGPLDTSPTFGFSVSCVMLLPRCGHSKATGEGGVVVGTAAGCIVLPFEGHNSTRTGFGGRQRGRVAHCVRRQGRYGTGLEGKKWRDGRGAAWLRGRGAVCVKRELVARCAGRLGRHGAGMERGKR
jgi:hypothetical protein